MSKATHFEKCVKFLFHFRPEEYKKKVAEYVKKYATEDALRDQCGGEVGW